MHVVATLDEYGKPAWITAMIVGFLLWWPIGLGVLAYLIWSGRMGCGAWKREWKGSEFGREVMRWRRGVSPLRSTGNRTFDEYLEETLRLLEEEVDEFQAFLQRPRQAKDKELVDLLLEAPQGLLAILVEGAVAGRPKRA